MISINATLSGTENRVLRNTFMLLALTVIFSAIMSAAAIWVGMPMLNPWVTLGVYIVLAILLHVYRNSAMGVVLCFALTGWLGLTLGPVLSAIIAVKPVVVLNAFIMASIMLVGLSTYAAISKKNFSFMGGFLAIGILVAFAAGLTAMFFKIALLSLVVSAIFVILSGGMILWQVSEIVHGGETNYVMAAVTLYVSFYNIFTSLINLLGHNSD